MKKTTNKYELARWGCNGLAGAASACILTAIGAGLHTPEYEKAVAQLLVCLILLSGFLFAAHRTQDFRYFWIIKTVTTLSALGLIYAFCMFMDAYKPGLGKVAGGAVLFCIMMIGFCLKSEKQLKAQREAEEVETANT